MKPMVLVLSVLLFGASPQGKEFTASEEAAIKQILLRAYVQGIHINRNEPAVRDGFHPDFLMHVFDDGKIIEVDLQMWLDHLELDGNKNPKPIDHKFDVIDVTGNAAVVKMSIYEDTRHIYTDYFGLYKFENGWKVVNKIFYDHD